MAQNPAQPIIDWRDKISSIATKMSNPIYRKDDPSWHDQMVKQADESFRKGARQKKVSAGSAPKTSKKSSSKDSAARKRITVK